MKFLINTFFIPCSIPYGYVNKEEIVRTSERTENSRTNLSRFVNRKAMNAISNEWGVKIIDNSEKKICLLKY